MNSPLTARVAAAQPTTTAAQDSAETAKLDRKRSQDRLHQRRHRAKRKLQLSTLEQDVKDLQATVAALGAKRQRLYYATPASNKLTIAPSDDASANADARFSERTQQRSALALKVVREYFETFKYGHSAIHQSEQEAFLRQVMAADASGVDVSGVEAFAEQWRLYGAFFWSTLLEPTSMRVRASGEVSVVEVSAELHLRLRADLAPVLCPQLARREHAEVLRTIVENVVCVSCKYTFVVEQDGVVSSLVADIDFLGALYRVVGSLAKVSEVVAGAQISMCTGKISCGLPGAAGPVRRASSVAVPVKSKQQQQQAAGGLNYRLQLSFLLSSSSTAATSSSW